MSQIIIVLSDIDSLDGGGRDVPNLGRVGAAAVTLAGADLAGLLAAKPAKAAPLTTPDALYTQRFVFCHSNGDLVVTELTTDSYYLKSEVDALLAAVPAPPLADVLAAGGDGTGPVVIQANAANRGLFVRDKDTVASNAADNVLFGVQGAVGYFKVNNNGTPSVNLSYDVADGSTFFGASGLCLDPTLPIVWRPSPFGTPDVRLRRSGVKAAALDDGAGGPADLAVTGNLAAAVSDVSGAYKVGGTQIVGAQRASILDVSGVSVAEDAEGRAAIASILSALRDHGLIAT